MYRGEIFLSPRLIGKRFEDHALPVEFMADFAALEELLIELAKHKYLEAHPGRIRVPRGFSDGVSLKISSIEDGSVISNLVLVSTFAVNSLFVGFENIPSYFAEAKEMLLNAVSSANSNEQVNLPSRFITYFNRIGKNIGEDESIDFMPFSPERGVILNKQSRRKILLSANANAEFLENGSWIGVVSELDKQQQTFSFRNNEIQISGISIPEEHKETIYQAFSQYENGIHIKLKGIAKFNASNKMGMVTTIEHLDQLDAGDIEVRINHISSLRNGWYYGEGTAFDKQKLNLFLTLFNLNCDPIVPNPSTYPTVDGKIQLEWSTDLYDDSLTIDLTSLKSEFHSIRFSDEYENIMNLDLNLIEDWARINDWFKQK